MWKNLTTQQQRILDTLGMECPACDVWVENAGTGISIQRTERGIEISIEKDCYLARAVSMVQELASMPVGTCIKQSPCYDDLGVMLDCSRNAVPKPATVKNFLNILAKMGYQSLQLYIEDIYEVEDYPYFGYGRGRYSKQELKELDAYAKTLSMELVPAIQTLAHLSQPLKWRAMKSLQDVNDILLIGSDETKDLIEKMFASIRECFSTDKINIGMDEAHLVGLGQYLKNNGYQDRTKLMMEHFSFVHEVAKRNGFKPMMWSDMFFRLATGGDYYAPDCKIDPAISEKIPEDTTLIYWDYYSETKDTYTKMIQKHKQISQNISFAGGAWMWSGFAPCNAFSIKLADLAHAGCKEQGVRNVIITMWGDNGAECSPFEVLPSLQYWAELCWNDEMDLQQCRNRFYQTTGENWDHFMALDQLVFTKENPAPGYCASNVTKGLLYEDILFPLFSNTIDLGWYHDHLLDCQSVLEEILNRETNFREMFTSMKTLCDVLVLKSAVQANLQKAWAEKNEELLRELADKTLPELYEKLSVFSGAFQTRWNYENKYAGLDIFDIKIGAQKERVLSAMKKICAFLNREISTIEELDERKLPLDPGLLQKGIADAPPPFWHDLVTPGNLIS